MAHKQDECEKAYKDWVRLLKHANAEDLLDDPYSIWDEAWRQVSMVTFEIIRQGKLHGKSFEEIQQYLQQFLGYSEGNSNEHN